MTKFFISPGDPAGIGPEITLKALSTNQDLQDKFVLAGDRALYQSLINENNLNLKYFHKYISDIPPSGTNNEVLEKIGLSLDKIINFIKKKLNES